MEAISFSVGIGDLPLFVFAKEHNMIENLYELIGGQRTVKAATERFYERVLEDQSLRPFFEEADMAHLRSRQVMFVSMLLGGTVYTGKDIHHAHTAARGQGMSHAHFDLFLKHFGAALEEVGVEPENAEKVVKRLESKRKTVLDT